MQPQLNWTGLQRHLQRCFKMLAGYKIVRAVNKLVLHFAPGICFFFNIVTEIFLTISLAATVNCQELYCGSFFSSRLLNISIHTCKPSREEHRKGILDCRTHFLQAPRRIMSCSWSTTILDGIHVRYFEHYEYLAG